MSRPGKIALASLLLLAAGAWVGERRSAAAANDPIRLLGNPEQPDGVVFGLLHGSPGQRGWQEAAKPFAERPELRPIILLALSREGQLAPRTRAWLAALAAGPELDTPTREASLNRMLATFALERPEEGGR